MYLGLERKEALECFDMQKQYPAPLEPKTILNENGVLYESMIDESITTSFSVRTVTLDSGKFTLSKSAAIYVVLEGEGEITGEDYRREIGKGSYFLMPHAAVGKFSVSGKIKFAECFA